MDDWTVTYLLGGGLSANDAPVERYRREGYVLGINHAGVHVRCDGIAFGDRGFAKEYKGVFVSYGKDAHGLFRWSEGVKNNLSPQATYWTRTRENEPSDEPGMIGMGPGQANTGVGCLNVAYHMGAKKVVLLGFDFDDANLHWYPCPFPKSNGVWPRRMRCATAKANLEKMMGWMGSRGVEVVHG